MTGRDPNRNYDFDMTDSDRAVALMARGINPYNEDEARNCGVDYMPEGRTDSDLEDFVQNQSAQVVSRVKRKKPISRKIDYSELIKLVKVAGGFENVKPNDVFERIGVKRRILRGAGYTHVYGGNGVMIPLAEAGDVRVGKVFQKTYKLALRANK